MVGSIRPESGMSPQEIPPDEINRIKQEVDELKEKFQELSLKLKPETSTSKPTPMGLLGRFVPRLSGQAAITKPSFSPEFMEAAQLLLSAFNAKMGELLGARDWMKVEQFMQLARDTMQILGKPIDMQTKPNIDVRTKIEKVIQHLAHCAEMMPSEAKFFNDLQAQLNQILK